MIEKVRDAGKTVLLIEQNASIALQISDFAYAMELGKITVSGTGQELLNSEEIDAGLSWNVGGTYHEKSR